MSEQLSPIKYEDIKKGYYFWAKKGDVWNNTRHMVRIGSSTTLCGTAMLGNNYAKEESGSGLEVGCQSCLAKYTESNS
jgi:hypothetical protein